jgi:hypothetical protein
MISGDFEVQETDASMDGMEEAGRKIRAVSGIEW